MIVGYFGEIVSTCRRTRADNLVSIGRIILARSLLSKPWHVYYQFVRFVYTLRVNICKMRYLFSGYWDVHVYWYTYFSIGKNTFEVIRIYILLKSWLLTKAIDYSIRTHWELRVDVILVSTPNKHYHLFVQQTIFCSNTHHVTWQTYEMTNHFDNSSDIY